MGAIHTQSEFYPCPDTRAVPFPPGFIFPCRYKDSSQEGGQVCDICQVSRSQQVPWVLGGWAVVGAAGRSHTLLWAWTGVPEEWGQELAAATVPVLMGQEEPWACALQASEGKGLGVLQTLLGEKPPFPTSLSKSLRASVSASVKWNNNDEKQAAH